MNNDFDSLAQTSGNTGADAPVLLDKPRHLDAGAGMRWVSQAWTLFKARPGLWIGMALAVLLIMMVLSMIPGLNFVLSLGFGVIIAGFVISAYELDENQNLEFAHLFAGFQRNLGQLLLLGLLYLLAVTILIFTVLILFGAVTMTVFGSLSPLDIWSVSAHGDSRIWSGSMIMVALLALLVFLALIVPVAMAIWFAPALIALNGMTAVDAMKLSFKACWVNIIPFFVYGLILVGLSFLALLTLGLGYLVLLPVIYITYYTSYREVLTEG